MVNKDLQYSYGKPPPSLPNGIRPTYRWRRQWFTKIFMDIVRGTLPLYAAFSRSLWHDFVVKSQTSVRTRRFLQRSFYPFHFVRGDYIIIDRKQPGKGTTGDDYRGGPCQSSLSSVVPRGLWHNSIFAGTGHVSFSYTGNRLRGVRRATVC